MTGQAGQNVCRGLYGLLLALLLVLLWTFDGMIREDDRRHTYNGPPTGGTVYPAGPADQLIPANKDVPDD